MALPNVEPITTKLSFARIAAMPAPSVQPALPNMQRDNKNKTPANVQSGTAIGTDKNHEFSPRVASEQRHEHVSNADVESASTAMGQIAIVDNEPNFGLPLSNGTNGETFEDGQSNISTSSLKQQSFDTKSIASVTTFAMDEKESIRPDDSASVRAVEDDDYNPGISRHSSFQHEVEAPPSGQRNSLKVAAPGVSMAARRYPGLALSNPPRFGDLPVSPDSDTQTPEMEVSESSVPVAGRESTSMPVLSVGPDEKLIEALASPKDRLPLLQLEEKIVTFITYGRDDILDLPPQNSFTRLLTHKLADYYNLAHQVTEDNSSVRIFRTAPSPLPVSLADIAKSIHAGPQNISVATQVKIMRRVQLGRQISAGTSTAASSSVPSKATSENGGDLTSEEGLHSPYEGTPGREKLKSREEREAQYKAVRDRIFGDFQESLTSESGSTGEVSASMSRSSSTSGGKKKSRKNKTPKDDTFTRRSEFVAYGPMHLPSNVTPVLSDLRYQDSYQTHQHPNYHPQSYGQTPIQQYPQYDQNLIYSGSNAYASSNNQMYSGNEGWNHMQPQPTGSMFSMQPMQPFAQQTQLPMHAKDQYPQSMQAIPPSPGWTQQQFPNAFPQVTLTSNNTTQWQNYNSSLGHPVPELQYTSSSRQIYPNDTPYANQPPALSAFNGARSLFNPQTRSFVPSAIPGRGGSRHGRKKGGHNDNMARGKDSPMAGNSHAVAYGDNNLPRYREDSLQQKYGTPANLPKKPPPSQVSPHFAGDSSTTPGTGLSGSTTSHNINHAKPATGL